MDLIFQEGDGDCDSPLLSDGAEKKSKKQVGYLLSKVSPLSPQQKNKLKTELHSGAVKVKK